MRLPDRGIDHDTVLATLDAFKARDLDWTRGRTWAYVYPAGDDVDRIGKAAYLKYLTENALDPTVFPSCMALENQLVALGAAHLGGDEHVAGNFTSGGTESILMACKTARDRARDLQPHIVKPEVVLPVTAHASFHKACAYFDLTPVLVEVDPHTFRAGPEAVEAAITDNTVLLVASAPSYAHGVVDDIEGIGAVAQRHGILMHVDACMGGWLLPFFEELGAEVPPFDFRVPGVTSISMDLHKYAFCPKGASLILYRDKEIRRYQIYSCSNWTGYTVINPTFQSTRTGGPVAAAWATLHYLGRDGYLARARVIWDAMQRVIEGCRAIPGLRVMGEPDFCLISVTSDEVNVFHVADEMRRRGWYIQPQLGHGDHRENVHISINPGVAPNTEAMLADLAEAVEAARALPDLGLADRVRAMLSTMDTDRLSDDGFEKLLQLGGIEGADLPERMAGINEILNTLPVRLNEHVLGRFFGDLNHLTDAQREALESVRSAMGAADPSPRPPVGGEAGVRARMRGAAARGIRQASRVAVGLAALGSRMVDRLEG